MEKNIIIIVKNDDETLPVVNELLNNIKNSFDILLENFQLDNYGMDEELFENCVGYILEEKIKQIINDISDEDLKQHFKFDKNKWYDFKYDNRQIKIITFKKITTSEENEHYSSTKLTSSQYSHRKDMIYVSLVYSIENNLVTIEDKLITDSDSMRIKYDKVIYESIFNNE